MIDKIKTLREIASSVDKGSALAIIANEYADLLEAQEKAEPVAWQFLDHDGKWVNGSKHNRHYENTVEAGYQTRQLYPHPPTTPTGVAQSEDSKAEPVLWVNGDDLELLDCVGITAVRDNHPGKTKGYFNVPLYTKPQTGVVQAAEKIRPGFDIHPAENWEIVESSEVVTVSIPHDLRPGQQLKFDAKSGGKFVFNMMEPIKKAPVVDECVEFEKAVTQLAIKHNYKFMGQILKKDNGAYSTAWVGMVWEGWQARAKLGRTHTANRFNYPRSPVKIVFDDGLEANYVRCDSCGHFRSPDHSCDGCEIAALKAKLGQTTDKACSAVVPDECAAPTPADTKRLDFIEANPDLRIYKRKKLWSVGFFSNYERDTHKTLREAIDEAMLKGGK